MRPGQRIPFQGGGFSPGFMQPRGPQPFSRGMAPRFSPTIQRPMGPMMGMARGAQGPVMGMARGSQGRQGGGLLARLLGGGSRAAAGGIPAGTGAVGNAAGAGGGLLKGLANPESINGFLTNAQQVLNSVQSMGPMIQQVQQFGPLIKNLPAMWKLYRGIQSSDNEEDSGAKTPKSSDSAPGKSAGKKKEKASADKSTETGYEDKEPVSDRRKQHGKSVPKIFI